MQRLHKVFATDLRSRVADSSSSSSPHNPPLTTMHRSSILSILPSLLLLPLLFPVLHATPLTSLSTTLRRETGFTLDRCRLSTDCLAPRTCQKSDVVELCNDSPGCFCFPNREFPCKSSGDCVRNEVCASVFSGPGQCTSTWYVHKFFSETELLDGGYSLDPCKLQSDCKGDRICTNTRSGRPMPDCFAALTCQCLLKRYPKCQTSADCSRREICATGKDFEDPVCLSLSVVDLRDDLNEFPRQPTSTDTPPVTSPPANPNATAIPPTVVPTISIPPTAVPTTSIPPIIVPPTSAPQSPSPSSLPRPSPVAPAPSVPVPPVVPSATPSEALVFESSTPIEDDAPIDLAPTPTEGGDIIVESPTPPDESGVASVSPSPTDPSNSGPDATSTPTSAPGVSPDVEGGEGEPTPAPVCIDAEALAHLERKDLVFAEHAWSDVLCDSAGSCATGGHIVVYSGRPMMMERYCALAAAGCEWRKKYVNSPRYSRGRRVPSKTDGLEFTAFAARYQTKVEERVLVAAVRVGL